MIEHLCRAEMDGQIQHMLEQEIQEKMKIK